MNCSDAQSLTMEGRIATVSVCFAAQRSESKAAAINLARVERLNGKVTSEHHLTITTIRELETYFASEPYRQQLWIEIVNYREQLAELLQRDEASA
jgi:hypothetical protein